MLDRLDHDDAGPFAAYRLRADVCRYQSFAPSDAGEAAGLIRSFESLEWDTPGTWFQLAVRERGSGHLVGDVGVHFVDEDRVEIGFTIDPTHQRKGFATEAVVALLDHLFGAMAKHRVVASVDPRNAPSVALLEKLGMRREAHFRQSLRFKGEWADDLVYAVLGSEWSLGRTWKSVPPSDPQSP